MIRRRHVFYIEGYDPQGAIGYNRLFAREFKRFQASWPVSAKLGELVIDSDDLAHWTIETSAPNWRVFTRYEFLRLEGVIKANLAEPTGRQLLRSLRWIFDDLFSGTLFRIFRASPQFGCHLAYAQLLQIFWIALAAAAGVLAVSLLAGLNALPTGGAVLLGIAVAVAVFLGLRPLAERMLVTRVNNGWPHLREFAHGMPSSYDRSVDAYAERIVASARSADADEIVVLGHSAGGLIGAAVMARALENDPELGRHGARVIYLTVGSLLPAYALHPSAARIRRAIRRLAVEPAVRWIDGQARKDIMNFWNFDPVAGVGVDAGPQRCNPLIWPVRFRDLLSPEFYRRNRFNYYRMHFQWIMANSMRAPYDYMMVCCGPLPVEHWARHGRETLASFGADAAYAGVEAQSA